MIKKTKSIFGAFTSSQWLLFIILVLGMAWRIFFLSDRASWERLVDHTGNLPSSAWTVFLVSVYLAMTVALVVFWNRNLKAILVVSLLVSALFPVAMYLFPVLQAFYLSYAMFGIATGIYHVPFLYYAGFELCREMRISAIAFFMFSFYLIVDAAVLLAPSLGFAPVFVIFTVLTAGAAVMGLRLKPPRLPKARDENRRAFPLKLAVVIGLAFTIGYFLNFLTESNLRNQLAVLQDRVVTGGAEIIRLVICLVFVFLGTRVKLFHLMCLTILLTVAAYVLSILNVGSLLPAFLLSRACGTLQILSFYVFEVAMVSRYPRRPVILSFLKLCGGAGIILGNTAGTAIAAFLVADKALFNSLPLLIFLPALLIIPFLLRSLNKEVDLDQDAGTGGRATKMAAAEGERDRQQLAEPFLLINKEYDMEYRLTEREMEIAAFLAERYDYRTISNLLHISMNTIKTHVKNIYRKFDLRNRKDLIKLIIRVRNPNAKTELAVKR